MLGIVLLKMAISQSSNVRERTGVLGALLLLIVISPASNGGERTDAQSMIVKTNTIIMSMRASVTGTNSEWAFISNFETFVEFPRQKNEKRKVMRRPKAMLRLALPQSRSVLIQHRNIINNHNIH